MTTPAARASNRQNLQARLQERRQRNIQEQINEPVAAVAPLHPAPEQVEFCVDSIKCRLTLSLDKAHCIAPSAIPEIGDSPYPITLEVSLDYLEQNQINPDFCQHIDKLRILAPRSTPTSQAISSLCNLREQCSRLQTLSLNGCGELDARVILSLTAKPLKVLDLTNCFKLIDEDVRKICESQRSLQELSLSGCSKLTIKTLEYICTLATLSSLNLSQCTMIFGMLDGDPLPAKLKKLTLQTLRISSPHLKDTDCLLLGPALNHVPQLDVRGCRLTYDGLRHFLGKESRVTHFEYDPPAANTLDGLFPTVLENFLGPTQPYLPAQHAQHIAQKIAQATNKLETKKKLVALALQHNLLEILQDRLIALGFHLACAVEAISLTHFKISCLSFKDKEALWTETEALMKQLFANETATCLLEIRTSARPRLDRLRAMLSHVTEIILIDDEKLTNGTFAQAVTSQCPNLLEATISDYVLTSEDITALAASCPRLAKLHISGSAIPMGVPEAFANLTTLFIENAVGLTFLHLANIWKKLPEDCKEPISEEEEDVLVRRAPTVDLITVVLGEYPGYLRKRASDELAAREAPSIESIHPLLQAALSVRSTDLFTACIKWANSYFEGWIEIYAEEKKGTISCKLPEHACWTDPAKRQVAANLLLALAKAYKYTLEVDGKFEARYKKELDAFLQPIQGAICNLVIKDQHDLKERTSQLPNLVSLTITSSPNTTDEEVGEVVGLCTALTQLTLQATHVSMVQVQRMKRPGLTITHDTLKLGALTADTYISMLAYAYESTDVALVGSLYSWFNNQFGEYLTIELTGDSIEPDELAIPEEVEQPEAIAVTPKISATRVHFAKPCLDNTKTEMIKMCLQPLGALDIYSPASDEFYSLLQLCTNSVQSMHLFPTNSPDSAFLAKWLPRCLHLEKLTVFSCKVRASDLPAFPHGRLERLELINCETVSGSMFAAMRQAFPAVVHLNLAQNAHLQDSDIKQLGVAFEGRLDSLDVSECTRITDASLVSIGEKFKNIRTLKCNRTTVTIKKKIPNLRGVKRVSFAGCKNVSDNSLLLFGDDERDIRTLDLSGCSTTGKGIVHLAANSPLITRLILASCNQITDDDLTLIAKKFFLMKAIDISNCSKVTEKGILALTTLLPNLQSIQAQGNEQLPALLRCPLQKTLNKSLEVKDARNVTDDTVKVACYFNPFLEEITLQAHRLTDKSIEHIKIHFKNTLKMLRVVNCPGISLHTLQTLRAEMPTLVIQNI